jgi:hypothetical protein
MPLTYIPPVKPKRPFVKGDVVLILSRDHQAIGEQIIARGGRYYVSTDCGREWSQKGWWRGDDRCYPFPSIVLKSQFQKRRKPSA